MSTRPLLVCEALGFSPQLLLDDIINVANQAVQDGVNGMEEFLQKWMDQRAEKLGGDWDGTQEVEQGLVAFQTLLEYHTDIAFDFFEAWSLRNIFVVPQDLPVVLPHHEKLDLTATLAREQDLLNHIEQLRRKIDAVCLDAVMSSTTYSLPLATKTQTNVSHCCSFISLPASPIRTMFTTTRCAPTSLFSDSSHSSLQA